MIDTWQEGTGDEMRRLIALAYRSSVAQQAGGGQSIQIQRHSITSKRPEMKTGKEAATGEAA